MNRTKREILMQRLPAAAEILALVPDSGANGSGETVVHTAAGDRLKLPATTEYVLSCLAEREDKEIRLIRRNAARLLARRRNIILPILHGCVLAPVMMRPVQKRCGRLGDINIARAPLVAPSARRCPHERHRHPLPLAAAHRKETRAGGARRPLQTPPRRTPPATLSGGTGPRRHR